MNKGFIKKIKLLLNNRIFKLLPTSLGALILLATHLSQAAIYDPSGNKIPDTDVNSFKVNWKLLKAKESQNYNGVGLLDGEQKVCTAFFINTGGNDTAPAYAMTNGHCYEGETLLPGANEITVNRPSEMVFKLNYFVKEERRIREVGVRRVVYATMKNTDIAILELNTTFKQLLKEGFTPLTIDKTQVQAEETVEVVGVPVDGVKASMRFLHKALCEIGQSANIREDVYQWQESIRHRCSVVGGMSGSPMISLRSNRVVAIVNTGVDDKALSKPACSLNRPCEVLGEGKIATFPNENYAQRVSNIPSCFDRNGVFNLNLQSCRLEKP